jgi:non-canonical poly(A) RNA polymerase PAPD5/7
MDNDISGGTREIDLILRTFASAHTTLKNRVEYLALVQGPNKSILGPIIGANFEEYIEQRNQLRRVFMTEQRFAKHRLPPPPPPGPYPVDGAQPLPPLPDGPPPSDLPVPPAQKPAKKSKTKTKGSKPEPEDISSDDSSSETKSSKSRRGETRRQVCQERAARIKRLRPDLKKLPNTLSLRQARRHAGYETNEEMEKDLNMREQRQTSA